ncbi:magnesium chelatase [Galdieria sulphuraria]|uniref:Magnesium chelatase n=1 Tax=Galdieria sulphuraria TaxID=130081 RepID=M2W4D5_GALSU|nr:magnesium chelatase [Galdieria sulphuraria]EME30616.1 magnesium chelatase [Galdieria sulphuraria]|eukprot:XP_005707136.1 magnesium chelatase [Galdieria sulphuraria]
MTTTPRKANNPKPHLEYIQVVVLAPNEKLFYSFLTLADIFQQQMSRKEATQVNPTENNESMEYWNNIPLLNSKGEFVSREVSHSSFYRSTTLSHLLPALQPVLKVFLIEQWLQDQGNHNSYLLLQQAVQSADVIVTGWIFNQQLAIRVAEILKPVHQQLLACIVFPSSPILIPYNKLGQFELCRWTETQNILSHLCFSKETCSDSPKTQEETNQLELKLLESFRILPKLLNYIGEEKREDICTYMLSYRHWVASSPEDVKLCLSFIIERSLMNMEKENKEEDVWMTKQEEDAQTMKTKIKQLWQAYCESTSSTVTIRSLPSPKKLQSSGHHELARLIAIYMHQYHCQLKDISILCQFKYSISCQREWNRFAQQLHQKFTLRYPVELEKELLQLSEKIHKGKHLMPLSSDVLAENRHLHQSILQLGGYRKAAKILGLQRYRRSSKPISKSMQEFTHFEKELRTFLHQRAQKIDSERAEWIQRIMPRMVDFREAGRTDLLDAIQYHGGQHAVARKLGLQMHYQATCNEYIQHFSCLEKELKRLISEELGDIYQSNEMPTLHDLRQLGRIDLIAAIRIHGGMHKVASKMNWKLCKGSRSTQLKIKDLNWLKIELERWIKKQGLTELCIVPTTRQLLEDGRPDLVRAIQFHGGRETVAKQFGMVKGDKTIFDESFFLTDWSGLEEEEESQVNSSKKTNTRRESHYWCRLENVRKELLAFIYEYGQPGVMPTRAELLRAGRGDLLRGMTIHGGQKVVARDLSLVMVSQVKKSK